VYRLQGYDTDWQVTRDRQAVYRDLPLGDYTFEVKAVDRNLTYSVRPANIRLTIHPDYTQLFLWSGLGLSLLGLVLAGGYAQQKRRAQLAAERALMREMEDELDTARELQMRLMPTESPQVAGYDFAGDCLTVNHVGGDFYQYFQEDGKLSCCLADVTGHAMEAAVPVVMFSGILYREMESLHNLENRLASLNRSLSRSLGDRKFICFTMAEIDTDTKRFRLASCGSPYPLHFHNGEVTELQVDGYPLGVREDTTYDTIEAQLSQGDYLVMYSDGIPETINKAEEMFGYERTIETVRECCGEGISAEALVARLMSKAREFAGEEPQADDMTCVVVRIEAKETGQ
jgi:phosphoserine phosphatase RsbU/P